MSNYTSPTPLPSGLQEPHISQNNERDDLERRCEQLQRKQAELEEALTRCKVTIQTQSQVIQHPKSAQRPFLQQHGNQPVPRSVQPAYNQVQYQQRSNVPQPFYQQHILPPLVNPFPAPLPGTLGYGLTAEQRAQPCTPTQATKQPYGDYPVKNQFSQSSPQPPQSQPPLTNPSYFSQSSFPTTPRYEAPRPNPAMSMALVKVTNTAQDLGFSTRFEGLFTMSERYAFSHINFPSSTKDSMLSSYIKGKLTQVAGESTGNLMSNGQTRYHVVARVINQWICQHILTRSCFGGLDQDVDKNIEMYAGSIYQCKFRHQL
jgi:hypothetical protein